MSPIKGLTDRGLSFPIIGHIRKGIKEERKRQDGTTYTVPIDLKYFRVEFDVGERVSADRFLEKYGPEPQAINVMLPFNEINRCWDAWLEAYTAGRMLARSDGEFIQSQVNPKTGEWYILNGVDENGNPVPHPKDNI